MYEYIFFIYMSSVRQILVYCVTALHHCLNQYWLLISIYNFNTIAQATIIYLRLNIIISKSFPHLTRTIVSAHSTHNKVVWHYNDVIMGAVASQITSLTIVYSTADQRKHKSSASRAFVRGTHRGPVNSPHKWPVTRKMFPFNGVIMARRYHGHGLFRAVVDREVPTAHRAMMTSHRRWRVSFTGHAMDSTKVKSRPTKKNTKMGSTFPWCWELN